ncbi:MAG TPA: GyrI-like domain-containing protein [Actinoplanes sp.]
MTKVDFRRQMKELYAPSGKDFSVVDVPGMPFLMVDGNGDPNTAQAYADAVEALYSVSYAVKFASKHAGRDYVVPPLEGLWSADDPSAFGRRAKDEWCWTMMIMQPAWITADMVEHAITATATKKNPPALPLVRFEEYEEGTAVQILHVGSYDDEAPTLRRLHQEYMPAHGYTFNGRHHEIYLSDPRRTEPAKLRTVLRQPVKRE